jgi:uncharacterized protein YaiI (UPF0178 family)
VALDPRGTLYTAENVRERLSLRNFMDELRGSGVNTGGPATLGKRERQLFANQLDRWLARATPSGSSPAPAAGTPPAAGNSPAD